MDTTEGKAANLGPSSIIRTEKPVWRSEQKVVLEASGPTIARISVFEFHQLQQTWMISFKNASNKGMRKNQWSSIFAATCWNLWKQRNRKIFEGKEIPVWVLGEVEVQDALLWLKFC